MNSYSLLIDNLLKAIQNNSQSSCQNLTADNSRTLPNNIIYRNAEKSFNFLHNLASGKKSLVTEKQLVSVYRKPNTNKITHIKNYLLALAGKKETNLHTQFFSSSPNNQIGTLFSPQKKEKSVITSMFNHY